ncbi:hypothetical protein PA598K_04097 [Paenibacillus sp. 598K]|uniref:zf-HC2 domain-containing protein n=1 Tax=Paenibacillus sp. 598K TaxID=1117987 RepID=UPI000FF9A13E|nr:zf-HC2 domain-containing protein [Paenibacillus sp. 598K]GBF75676.1 hypothetical protein PA598K_04097 [Paenibacillus sp. 598K]
MKISCEIIRDLLPLYHDGVCSNDSKALVEEHLAYCDSCRADLEAMTQRLPLNDAKQNMYEAEAVKNLSIRWKKGMMKSLVKGSLLTLAIIVLVVLIGYSLLDFKVVPKP